MKKQNVMRLFLSSGLASLLAVNTCFAADSTQVTPLQNAAPAIGHTYVAATGSIEAGSGGWASGYTRYLMIIPPNGPCPPGSTPRVIVVPNIVGNTSSGTLQSHYAYTFDWNIGPSGRTSVPRWTDGWYYTIGVDMAIYTWDGSNWAYRPWLVKVLYTLYCDYGASSNTMQQ